MSKLVDELMLEHKSLVSVFGQIPPLLKAGKHAEISSHLKMARNGLLAHLKKEDAELYTALAAAGHSDARAKELHFAFSSEMQNIAKAALQFFDRYEAISEYDAEFGKDLDAVVGVLGKRIFSEENILYPHYNKTQGESGDIERGGQQQGYLGSLIIWAIALGGLITAVYFMLK